MTENGTIPNEKLHILVVENLVENLKISFRDWHETGHSLRNFFFSEGNQKIIILQL
jgi:hypothetical protein